jgi:uncharacterized protein YoxC
MKEAHSKNKKSLDSEQHSKQADALQEISKAIQKLNQSMRELQTICSSNATTDNQEKREEASTSLVPKRSESDIREEVEELFNEIPRPTLH